ncbi:MAG: GvpL/GvpF family gas vesicle protein [Bacteroidales bacterium]
MDKIIYAILTSNDRRDELTKLLSEIRGISDSALFNITYNNISVVAGDFSSNKIIVDKEFAIDYARVIEDLAQHFTLLPVRFGTLMESPDAIKEILIKYYDEFKQNLQKVENKYEFSLKVLWDYEKCSGKIRIKTESEDQNAAKLFHHNSISTDYLLKKLKKHRFENALLKHVEQLIEEISSHLAQLNPIHKFQKMVTPNIILDAVFLLEKNKKDEFIHAIDHLKSQHDDLNFLLTGPWPPYNFVEITLK